MAALASNSSAAAVSTPLEFLVTGDSNMVQCRLHRLITPICEHFTILLSLFRLHKRFQGGKTDLEV